MQPARSTYTNTGIPLEGDGSTSTDDSADVLEAIIESARVQYLTVGEMVHAILRQAIVNGVLGPGAHLRQDSLAQAIGVSRIPVRSALLQLESEGLVVLHPHRGFTVRELTPEQVREIYELRWVLESHALRRAIRSMGPKRLRRLEQLAHQLDLVESGDEFVKLSFAFYRELYDADENPLLVALIERLHNDVGRYWLSRRVLGRDEQGAHTKLLEHARKGDADAAVTWLNGHLEEVAEQLIHLIAATEGSVP